MPVSFVNGASAGSTGTIITTGSSGQSIPKAALPTGSVLQVVSTTKTDIFTTSAGAYTDITGLSVSITPTSSTSRILVLMTLTCGNSTATVFMPVQLVRDSTPIYRGDAAGSRTRASGGAGRVNDVSDTYSLNFNFLDSPATTSSTTYKVQIVANAGTCFVNSNGLNADNTATGRYASTITVMEIAA